MALCVDEYFLNFVGSHFKKNHDWNRLDETVLYTTHDAFMFWNFAFHFRMLHNVINNLIPTGIMKLLVEQYYTKSSEFPKLENNTKVLSLDDLMFGFKIWFVCCLVSLIAYIGERIYSWYKAPKKVRFEKIEPLPYNLTEAETVLKTELVTKFRVKKLEVDESNCNMNEEIVDDQQSMEAENYDLSLRHWNLFE